MADRYLRATGNWNGAVWASTSGGTAGSASTPTSSDLVYIMAGLTMTLDTNAAAAYVEVKSGGTVNLSSYKLTIADGSFDLGETSGGGTLNMGSGHLECTAFRNNHASSSLIKGTSLLTLNIAANYNPHEFKTGSANFNDVIIYMGIGIVASRTLNITGSPTFRSLIIQSKNSAAHTVNFDSSATITVDKFVGIGSSSGSKLTIKPSSGTSTIDFTANGTSYGQFLDMQATASGSGVPKYIGSNSTQSSGMGWLLQDPPKIATLVDPLTTAPASNTNWTISGLPMAQETTGIEGGGYEATLSGSYPSMTGTNSMVSTDTYDMVDSEFIFEIPQYGAFYGYGTQLFINRLPTSGTDYTAFTGDVSLGDLLAGYHIDNSEDGQELTFKDYSGEERERAWSNPGGTDADYQYLPRFFSVRINSDLSVVFKYSQDGSTWKTMTDVRSLSAGSLPLFRSVRIGFGSLWYDALVWNGPTYTLGSVNMLPASTQGIKVYTGSEWAMKPVKVWSGSAWQEKPVKRWNGTSWV